MFKLFNKKGDDDEAKSVSFLLKVLLIAIIATALYFMIKGVANAFLTK